jgi:hypothetical protein
MNAALNKPCQRQAAAAPSAASVCNLMVMNGQDTSVNSEKSTEESKKHCNVKQIIHSRLTVSYCKLNVTRESA